MHDDFYVDFGDREEYDILTLSMREFYVPAREWLQQVEQFESCMYYDYHFKPELYNQSDRMYIAPYPYKQPYWATYIQTMNRAGNRMDGFTERDCSNCYEGLADRIDRFIHRAVNEDVISLIDSNWDYGVIVHSISANYFPFQYSKIEGFSFIYTAAHNAICSVAAALERKPTVERNGKVDISHRIRAGELRQLAAAYSNKCLMAYVPEYKDPDGDYFFYSGSYGNPTEVHPLDIQQGLETKEYIREMFNAHAKVLCVT